VILQIVYVPGTVIGMGVKLFLIRCTL
jgi:hypothetical protein